MTQSDGAWFHCFRCGALFRGPAEAGGRGACPECGKDPVAEPAPAERPKLGRPMPAPVAPAEDAEAEAEGEPGAGASGRTRVRRKVRRQKKRDTTKKKSSHRDRRGARMVLYFVTAWAVLLVLLVAAVRHLFPGNAPTTTDSAPEVTQEQLEDTRLITELLPVCQQRVQAYLAAGDVNSRLPLVLGGEKLLPEMTRARLHEAIFPNTTPIVCENYQLLHTPAGRALDTMWKQDDGSLYQAVFFPDTDRQWKIEWHAFTRASSMPWSLFLTDGGDAEGTFRVLARERIGGGGRSEEWMGLVLYTVRPGHPGEPVNPSPEIRILRGSPEARVIQAAFDERAKDLGAFESRMVTYDPDEMIRLTVRLAREDGEERKFLLRELIAPHWIELPSAASAE